MANGFIPDTSRLEEYTRFVGKYVTGRSIIYILDQDH